MTTDYSIACRTRRGDAAYLAEALQAVRQRTLALLDAYEARLGPQLVVPYARDLNPACWEVGHIAWFCDFWIARNRQCRLGTHCDPDHARPEGRLSGADLLYDSSKVAHASRWKLRLLDLLAVRVYLAASLEETLSLLSDAGGTDDELYFYRLVLFHEAMHVEAATYMAQTLGIPLPQELRPSERPLREVIELGIPRTRFRLGYEGPGFAFDNELGTSELELEGFSIDSVAVSWRRFLPAVESGVLETPRYLRKGEGGWHALRFGEWQLLALDAAAAHVSWHEAIAWCRWAGRRLPTEAEWECAAAFAPGFEWGEVWEWTASRFAPFEGFVPGPYRDYSCPGFDEVRYVLKGASKATDRRLAHPKYRNFFPPERSDIQAGFRSCPL